MQKKKEENSLTIREIVATSRPFSWINTAAPFFVGYVIGAGRVDLDAIIGSLYFLVAYNLLMYGVNDIYDYESDVANPRKNSIEGGLVDKKKHQNLWLVILIVNLPFLVYLFVTSPNSARIVLIGIIFFCFSYSAKPLRLKEVPILDSINSSLHFVLPFVFGLLYGGSTEIFWPAVVAFFLWGMASQAFGSIQDIKPDRAAKISSIATVLGAKRTTRICLALYIISALITAVFYFPYGIIVGFLLVLYALNVSFFLKYRSDAHGEKFHRGWQNFLWLNWLVGFLIAQILLISFDPFGLREYMVVIFSSVLIILFLFQSAITIYNFQKYKKPKKLKRLSDWPKVSIIMHGYNQADNISSTMLSLLGQQYPNFEILFTDLGSSDKTKNIVSGFQDDRLKLVDIAPIKPGWTLHAWAAQQLLKQSKGEVVLLLSADTILLTNALSNIAKLLIQNKHALVSILPADQNKSLAQKVILAQNHFLMLGAYPSALLDRNHSKGVSASSNCIAFNKLIALEYGGFEIVKKSPLEDFDLGPALRQKGLKVSFYIGSDIATSQNHASLRQIISQNMRRFYPALHFSMPLTVSLIIGGIIVFVVPTMLLVLLIILNQYLGIYLLVAALLISYANRLFVTIRSKQSILSTIVFPFGVLVTMMLLWQSMIEYELVKPRWQKRTDAY